MATKGPSIDGARSGDRARRVAAESDHRVVGARA